MAKKASPIRAFPDVGRGLRFGSIYDVCRDDRKSSSRIVLQKPNNEVAQERANVLRIDNVQFVLADLGDLNSSKHDLGLFDQIICTEVIEHILNGKKLISDLSDLLKPRGKLLLTTPFKHYKPLIGDTLSELEDGGHVRWGYTHEEIEKLLNEAGIEVIERSFIGGFISQQVENVARVIQRLKLFFLFVIHFMR